MDEIENDIQDEIIEERNKKYRIVKIDGLVSETYLKKLMEVQGNSLSPKMETQNIEESCYIVINPGNT